MLIFHYLIRSLLFFALFSLGGFGRMETELVTIHSASNSRDPTTEKRGNCTLDIAALRK